jgi:mycofactocin system FadH/OYE family oxidoreductase 1
MSPTEASEMLKLTELLAIGRGDVVAPSRVMFGPHETNLGDGRCLSVRHDAYYARRAAGGAGIIVVEEAAVHPSDWAYERSPLASECGAGWASVGRAVAQTGTSPVLLAGLGHSGGQGGSHWSQREMWAPSAVPEVATREVPKVMEQADIDAVVSGFVAATRLAISSGLHGVEINAGQFSLVRQFMSGLTNMRTDEYGSDRLKFARDVLTAVRSAAGDAIVALRLSVDELAPWAGIVPEVGSSIAVELAPLVDLITVVRGSIYSAALTRPDGHVEPGFAIDLPRGVRSALREAGFGVPVVAQGSIVDWGQAEWALTSEAADAVEMTRAQIADADLVAKVRGGQSARIRPCILCNQTCKVRDNRNPVITCVVDPRSGHELDDPAERSAGLACSADLGRVLSVIGGGVAGLEAARLGAIGGASVTVYERSADLGGTLRLAARGSGRGRLALFADWLESEGVALGVAFERSVEVNDEKLVLLRQAGDVIVASGSVAAELAFEVALGGRVLESVDLLADLPGFLASITGSAGHAVAVWDPIGGPIALSIAELLAPMFGSNGGSVTLITPDLLVGEKLSLSGDLAPSQGRLHGNAIRLVKRAIVRRVDAEVVTIEDRFTGIESQIPASVLVACGHRVPNLALDPDERLPQIGDRVAPRSVLEAVLEARRAVTALG